MSVVLYRIDDRLVHGQVMVAWTKIYQTNRIFVVDEETIKNAFLFDVMRMTMPQGYELIFLGVEEAIKTIKEDPPGKKSLLLAKGPETILALMEGGLEIPELNVGNMGAKPGRKAVMRSIQLSGEEYAVLKAIEEKGTRVYFQIFPDAKAVELNKIKM